MLLGLFGLWLVHLGRFGYGSGWVDAAIVLFVVALALGGLGGRRPKHARLLATKLAAAPAPISESYARGATTPSRAPRTTDRLPVVLAILVLMVFK